MRRFVTGLLILLVVAVEYSTAADSRVERQMTPEIIEEAIRMGSTEKVKPYKAIFGSSQPCYYSTPFIRVALAAQDAKRNYKPFTAADVTEDLIAPELHVYAEAHEVRTLRSPLKRGEVRDAIGVTAVVVARKKAKEPDNVIQPLRTLAVPVSVKNLFGAVFEATGMTAAFPIDALDNDREIRVVYTNGKERAFRFEGIGRVR